LCARFKNPFFRPKGGQTKPGETQLVTKVERKRRGQGKTGVLGGWGEGMEKANKGFRSRAGGGPTQILRR